MTDEAPKTEKTPVAMMSGEDASKPENILRLFEQLTGRKATPAQVAELLAKASPKH